MIECQPSSCIGVTGIASVQVYQGHRVSVMRGVTLTLNSVGR